MALACLPGGAGSRASYPAPLLLLSWGGLLGGILLALALGLPNGLLKKVLKNSELVAVLFSSAVQSLTPKPRLGWLRRRPRRA